MASIDHHKLIDYSAVYELFKSSNNKKAASFYEDALIELDHKDAIRSISKEEKEQLKSKNLLTSLYTYATNDESCRPSESFIVLWQKKAITKIHGPLRVLIFNHINNL